MKKNTQKVQSFFTGNPKTDVLFFTCSNSVTELTHGFFKQTDAQAHATNLAKKNKALNVVTKVTKAEAFAADPEGEKNELETALDKAQVNYDEAVKARTALDAAGTGPEKTAASKLVTAAKKVLDDAQAAVDASQA